MKKCKYLTILRVIQLILSLFLAVTLFLGQFHDEVGLSLPVSVQYLPIAASAVILVLFCLEFIRSAPWIRLVYLAIALSVCIMMGETLEMLNMTIWLFGIIYFVLVLIALIRKSGTKQRDAENAKCLPVGIFSKRDLNVTYAFFVALFVIAIAIVFCAEYVSVYIWYALPVFFVLTAVIYGVVVQKTFALIKTLSYANREMSFQKFDDALSGILKNNLHPQSVCYLHILRANYLFAYDVAEGIKQFEETERPTAKQYVPYYDMLKVIYFINREAFEEAEAAFSYFKAVYPMQKKNIALLDRAIKVYTTREEIPDIEALLSKGKFPFAVLSDTYELMAYYTTRGNREKAKECAQKILQAHSDFAEWNKCARETLDDSEPRDKATESD